MAVGAIGDVWFTVLFSRSIGEYSYLNVVKMSPVLALGISALVATGLFTFGASLNDLLDALEFNQVGMTVDCGIKHKIYV